MKRLVLCVLFGALLLLAAQAAFAASEITVTVTLGQLGVGVTPSSWALGIVTPTRSRTSWITGNPGHFQATNIGNTIADITISAGPTSPSGWTVSPSNNPAAVDEYHIEFGIGSPPYDVEPAYTYFLDGPTELAPDIPVAGTVDFDLQFTAPTSDSTYDAGGETFSVTLGAAESTP